MDDLHLWAILTNKENGYDLDKSLVRDMPLGTKLKVVNIHIGGHSSAFEAQGYPLSFNTVQFGFVDDDGDLVNIFKEKRFNPYLDW